MEISELITTLTERCALAEDDPQHIDLASLCAFLEHRLVPASNEPIPGGEGTLYHIRPLLARFIERGYHLRLQDARSQKSHWRAGTLLATWPPFVRQMTRYQGRLDAVILVGTILPLRVLAEVAGIELCIDLDQCTDVIPSPVDGAGKSLDWYVAFGQLGALYANVAAAQAGAFLARGVEVGLTIREGLHLPLLHPLPIRECAVALVGSRCKTPKGEDRVPVIRWSPPSRKYPQGKYILSADLLEANYPGTGIASRGQWVIGKSSHETSWGVYDSDR